MKRFIVLGLKILLSAGLVWFVLSHIHMASLSQLVLSPQLLIAGLVGLGLVFCQTLLAANRQILLVEIFAEELSFADSLRIWFAGLFMGQAFVTFVAGDVYRAFQLVKLKIPAMAAGQVVVLDRVIGLLVLLAMTLVSMPFILAVNDDPIYRFGLLVLSAGAVVAIGGFLVMIWLPKGLRARLPSKPWTNAAFDFAMMVNRLVGDRRRCRRVVGLTLVMHLINTAVVVAFFVATGASASLWMVALISTPALLLSMLPISLAGWGVREAAMVTGLGLVGVPSAVALTVSIGFGLVLLTSSLPGALTLFRRGHKRPGIDRGGESLAFDA